MISFPAVSRPARLSVFRSRSACVAAGVLGFASLARAQSNLALTYNGPPTGDLSMGANYTPSYPPSAGTDLLFTGSTAYTLNDASAGLTTFSLNDNDTAAVTLTLANRLVLGGSSSTSGNSVSGTAADILYAAAGSTLNISGASFISLGAITGVNSSGIGNFDIAGTASISNVIAGSTGFNKTGAGTLTLTGTNTYTGATTLTAGIVNITTDLNLGAATANAAQLTFNGGTLQTAATLTLATARGITLNSGGGTIDTQSFTTTCGGIITGAGNLTKNGTGTLLLTGADTFTGTLTIANGTLNANGGTAISTAGAITLGSSTGGPASLLISTSETLAATTTITLGGNAVGTLLIGLNYAGGGGSVINSPILLNGDNLTLSNAGSLVNNSAFTINGAITGTGNLTFTGGNHGAGIGLGSVNNMGTLTDNDVDASGAGAGQISFTSVGANVTGITSNSTGTLAIAGTGLLVNANGETLTTTSSGLLNVSGGVDVGATGTPNLTLDPTGTGGITLGTSNGAAVATMTSGSVNNLGTITNSGTGEGVVTIAGTIGSNVGSLLQNSSTSPLFISNAGTLISTNTAGITSNNSNSLFTGPVGINAGVLDLTVATSTSTSTSGSTTTTTMTGLDPLGTGTVTLGNSSGNASATLYTAQAATVPNPITVNAGSTGTQTIVGSTNSTVTGAISLMGSNLVLGGLGGGTTGLGVTGGISGAGNLTLVSAGAPATNTFITLAGGNGNNINHLGSITDNSFGGGYVMISGLGASVTSVTENSSPTSILRLGANGAYTGDTFLVSGALSLDSATALGVGTGGVAPTLHISGGTLEAISSNVTVSGGALQSWTGNFTFGGANALNLGPGAVTLGGNIVLSDSPTNTGATLTLGGAIGGTGNLALAETLGGITFNGQVNNAGTLGSVGIGTQGLVFNGGIGPAVTGFSQGYNGTSTIAAASSYTGATTITDGGLILNFAAAGAPTANILYSTGLTSADILSIGPGTLTLADGTVAGASQAFYSTNLAAGPRLWPRRPAPGVPSWSAWATSRVRRAAPPCSRAVEPPGPPTGSRRARRTPTASWAAGRRWTMSSRRTTAPTSWRTGRPGRPVTRPCRPRRPSARSTTS